MIAALALLLAAQHAPPVSDAAADCKAASTSLPAGMKGWTQPSAAQAAASAATARALPIGKNVVATLLTTPKVTYAVVEKPGEPTSNGGIFSFSVPTAGRYRVALGAGAWINVLKGTVPVTSVAHAHGPACSTIRKMVDFKLQPGRYLLQITGSSAATLPVMVSRVL